jgi:rsbT co-antagonist protein RsbR
MQQTAQTATLPTVIRSQSHRILENWVNHQLSSEHHRRDLLKEPELRRQTATFLSAFVEALQATADVKESAWKPVKDLLAELSRVGAQQGLSPTETAYFVFSLKQPLSEVCQQAAGQDGHLLSKELLSVFALLDTLGLYTTEVYQHSREDIIARQQQELLELSTPVVQLWDKIVALPLIGTLDSARTQVVMESLLERIVATGARIAIIDITGVPTVDTLVAQHLMKTVAAARLMGADCIISGIRPQIAQTIVHLGVNLNDIVTKATLADAFQVALQRTGETLNKA